jgi:hypothetical protein
MLLNSAPRVYVWSQRAVIRGIPNRGARVSMIGGAVGFDLLLQGQASG